MIRPSGSIALLEAVVPFVAVVAPLVMACGGGPDPTLLRAQHTSSVTWQLITETDQALKNYHETAGGEAPSAEDEAEPAEAPAAGETSQEVRVARDWVSRGVPDPDGHIARALTNLHDRFNESQHAMRLWSDGGIGRLAWETLAPCLLDGIVGLREAFDRAAVEYPLILDDAESLVRGFTSGSCAEGQRESRQREREGAAASH